MRLVNYWLLVSLMSIIDLPENGNIILKMGGFKKKGLFVLNAFKKYGDLGLKFQLFRTKVFGHILMKMEV